MTELKTSLLIALTLSLAAVTAQAQDAAAPAAEAPAATTEAAPEAPAADGPGSTYVAETHGDWAIQCVRTEEGNDPCQMYQLLKDDKGNNVADIAMVALPKGGKAVAGATIVTPLETMLTQNVSLAVDTAEPRYYPFTFCAQMGCVSRIGLTEDELAAYKKGNQLQMIIVPMAAPDKKVQLAISLKGFTAAYEAVEKANADNQ